MNFMKENNDNTIEECSTIMYIVSSGNHCALVIFAHFFTHL